MIYPQLEQQRRQSPLEDGRPSWVQMWELSKETTLDAWNTSTIFVTLTSDKAGTCVLDAKIQICQSKPLSKKPNADIIKEPSWIGSFFIQYSTAILRTHNTRRVLVRDIEASLSALPSLNSRSKSDNVFTDLM